MYDKHLTQNAIQNIKDKCFTVRIRSDAIPIGYYLSELPNQNHNLFCCAGVLLNRFTEYRDWISRFVNSISKFHYTYSSSFKVTDIAYSTGAGERRALFSQRSAIHAEPGGWHVNNFKTSLGAAWNKYGLNEASISCLADFIFPTSNKTRQNQTREEKNKSESKLFRMSEWTNGTYNQSLSRLPGLHIVIE